MRVALGLVLFAAASVALASETTLSVAREGDATRVDVALSGRLVSYALPVSRDGRRTMALLLAPVAAPPAAVPAGAIGMPPCPEPEQPGPPLTLIRLDPLQPTEPIRERTGLPHDGLALDGADLDGDGADELLLARKGALFVVDEASRLETLFENPDLDWRAVHPRAVREPGFDRQPLATSVQRGKLQLHGAAGEGAWVLQSEAMLPLEGHAGRTSINVRQPIPRLVGRGTEGTWWFATPPETVGNTRLRMHAIDLGRGASTSVECWARLPEPEDVLEHFFRLVDGKPHLLVTTKPAGKLTLFGEKRLRLFSLAPDRSRRGADPVLAVDSGMNLWQAAEPRIRDANGDGREDLVVAYWKGLTDDRVVLDVYPREADGSFQRTARTTAFNVSDGDRSFLGYGHDLDGDHWPDLVVRGEDGFRLYPGQRSADGTKLVGTKPRSLPLPADGGGSEDEIVFSVGSDGVNTWTESSGTGPQFVDLDLDGTRELLWIDAGGPSQAGTIRWLRLDSADSK